MSKALVAATAFVALVPGVAHAVLLVNADFETTGSTTFSGGASRDCTSGNTGSCSVKIDPVCCSQYASAVTPVNGTMTGRTAVTFAFNGESNYGDVDTAVTIRLDYGSVTLDLTDGVSPNNGVSLHSEQFSSANRFAFWGPNAWNAVRIDLDPNTDTATATVAGGTATVGIPWNATRINNVEFGGWRWSSYGWPMRYDSLQIDTPNATPSTTLVSPSNGAALGYYGPHSFTVRATDGNGDASYSRISVWENGVLRRQMTTSTVASGTNVTATASPKLPPGTYTWSAYSVDSRGAVGPTSITRSFTVNPPAFKEGVFVALGDSFSSGEGAPVETPENYWTDEFEAGTDNDVNKCHRSGNAYPRLTHKNTALPTRMSFLACSGAVARNVTSDAKYNEASQLSRVPEDTTLVTMSIGGNDAGFGKILKECIFTLSPCKNVQEPYLARRLARLGAAPGTYASATDRAADPEIDYVQPLSEVYQLLRGRAPYAKVVIVGYPKFFMPNGFMPGGRPTGCEAIFHEDQLWMNDAVRRINDIIESRALAAGFLYADVEDAFLGHHLCDSDSWMNGMNAVDQEYSFHPNHAGHNKESQIVLNKVLYG